MYIFDAIFIWLGFYFSLCFHFENLEPDLRWKAILWFDSIQIAHFMNVSFTSGSGQTEAGQRVFFYYFKSPCLLPPWLWFPWRLEDDWLHINSEPRSCGCHGVVAVTLHLSPSVCQCCAFFFPPDQPQFDCCTVTQPTLQRAAQASSALPLEGALQSKLHREKWFWFYWEYKMFYQNPFQAFCVFFHWFSLRNVCVCFLFLAGFNSHCGGSFEKLKLPSTWNVYFYCYILDAWASLCSTVYSMCEAVNHEESSVSTRAHTSLTTQWRVTWKLQ